MSNDMVRELFRGLENTLYERLRIIEDILAKQRENGVNPHMSGVEKNLNEISTQMQRVEAETVCQINDMNARVSKWMSGMSQLQADVNALRDELRKRKDDERPVELVQAQLEQQAAESAALDADVNASEVEKNAKVALQKAVHGLSVKIPPAPTLEELEKEEEEEEEEEVVEEGEVVEEEEEIVEEEEEIVEEEEEEVVEEEEEEEEQAEELVEFKFKGKTYYHDSEFKVYIPDEDGAVGEPIGIYVADANPPRIRRLP